MSTLPSPHVPAPSRPALRLWLGLALSGAVISGGLGVATILFHLPIRLSQPMGLFFACFAALKFALILDALAERRLPMVAGETSRTQAFGSPTLFRLWIAYKFIAGLLALAVAIGLLVYGSTAIDRLIG